MTVKQCICCGDFYRVHDDEMDTLDSEGYDLCCQCLASDARHYLEASYWETFFCQDKEDTP